MIYTALENLTTERLLSECINYDDSELFYNEIFAHISHDSRVSQKLAEKCGFTKTGEQYLEEFKGENTSTPQTLFIGF